MARNTSVTLGNNFDGFVASKVKEGRYDSTSEAIRAKNKPFCWTLYLLFTPTMRYKWLNVLSGKLK